MTSWLALCWPRRESFHLNQHFHCWALTHVPRRKHCQLLPLRQPCPCRASTPGVGTPGSVGLACLQAGLRCPRLLLTTPAAHPEAKKLNNSFLSAMQLTTPWLPSAVDLALRRMNCRQGKSGAGLPAHVGNLAGGQDLLPGVTVPAARSGSKHGRHPRGGESLDTAPSICLPALGHLTRGGADQQATWMLMCPSSSPCGPLPGPKQLPSGPGHLAEFVLRTQPEGQLSPLLF